MDIYVLKTRSVVEELPCSRSTFSRTGCKVQASLVYSRSTAHNIQRSLSTEWIATCVTLPYKARSCTLTFNEGSLYCSNEYRGSVSAMVVADCPAR